MNAPPLLRPMRSDEARLVLELQAEAVQAIGDSPYPAEILDAWARREISEDLVAFFLLNPEQEIRVVAEAAGQVVGYGAIVPHRNELTACYVASAARRRGIGRALVRCLEGIAADAGSPQLRLDAALTAAPFYQALGFQLTGHGQHLLHRNGKDLSMDCVKMAKSLTVS